MKSKKHILTFSISVMIVVCIIVISAFAMNSEIEEKDISSDMSSSTEPYIPGSGESEASKMPAEPVSEDALDEYWEMGALNVDNVPYMPLVDTAEELGYKVNVSFSELGSDWNPEYPDAVEYNYELIKDEKSLGIASLCISNDIVISYMNDQIFCNTNDRATRTSFLIKDGTIYMPAQFFKEALDWENLLP